LVALLGAYARSAEFLGYPMALRVFLLDDHELLRVGLGYLIEAEDDLVLVGEAGTGEEALARIPIADPDVAIIDLQLEHGDGIEVCRELRSRHSRVRCLVLSSFCGEGDILGALRAGAAGYLLKHRTGEEVLEAIRDVWGGRMVLDPSLGERVVNRARVLREPDPFLLRLSDQERRMLPLIAAGYTNRRIAEEMFLAEKTMRNYVSTLLSKLGMNRRSELAAYAARLKERGELHEVS
jgi:two-component system, NarL family, response regulator DevR